MKHKAGYVNIIGRPNVGKSTLMNQLVGEKISIITSKAQTTRHRILGIVNGDDFQIVFSDTPGIIKDPAYKMHEVMTQFVNVALLDADLILFVVDITDTGCGISQKKLDRLFDPFVQDIASRMAEGDSPTKGSGEGGMFTMGTEKLSEADASGVPGRGFI